MCKTLRNPTEPHDSRTPPTCRAPRAAPRRAPRSRVRGRRPPRRAPSRTHTPQPSARHTARVPPAEGRRWEAPVLATVRGLLVRGCSRRTRSPRARGRGEDHSERPRGEARREAGRVALRRPCAAVARPSTEQGGRRGQDGARSEGCGRPPSRRACGTGRGAWPRRAQGGSRGQALWSLGGASPRAHTQAVVSRRRSPLTTRMSGPEESPRDPDPPLGVERRWSLGGQHEHLPGADRASRRHVG